MRTLPATGTVEIVPSLLSADFSRLADEINRVTGEVHMLHLDIMDGHFVPNLTVGPVVVKKIRPCTDLYFDTHLMISDPLRYAPEFVQAGSDGITFHLEAVENPTAVIEQIRRLDVSVGISIKPGTPVEALRPIIGQVDMVLLMTVEPGFGGQDFLPESLDRCRTLRKLLRDDQRLEVDGGINGQTAPDIVAAGADTLVAGHAIFAATDPADAIRNIRASLGGRNC